RIPGGSTAALVRRAFHAASETNEHRLAPRRRPFCGCCGCRGRGRSESGQAGVRLQFLRRAAAHCTCSKELRPTARTNVPLAILSYLIFRRRRGCSLDPLRSSRIVYRPIESLASLFKTLSHAANTGFRPARG